MKKNKLIAVVGGGWSSEAEISRKSASAVAEGLKRLGYTVELLELSPHIATQLLELKPNLVWPTLHGSPGEDGTFQGLLEILKIPYVGSGVKTSSLCMDKDWTKRLLLSYGFKTPSYWVVSKTQKPSWGKLSFPLVVKPATEGSSLGLYIVQTQKELEKAIETLLEKFEKVLVEEFISGREFTCGFAANQVFTPLEIKPKSGVYDFRAKYTKGETDFLPVKDKKIKGQLQEITKKLKGLFELKDLARVDFRISEKGEPYILEINTLPGMTSTSLLPTMAKEDGYSFEELLELILANLNF
jgi:D-alanine-D-alanine ligase